MQLKYIISSIVLVLLVIWGGYALFGKKTPADTAPVVTQNAYGTSTTPAETATTTETGKPTTG